MTIKNRSLQQILVAGAVVTVTLLLGHLLVRVTGTQEMMAGTVAFAAAVILGYAVWKNRNLE